MSNVVNLRQARKAAARREKLKASAAATEAGRLSAADKAGVARARAEKARLEGKQREDE